MIGEEVPGARDPPAKMRIWYCRECRRFLFRALLIAPSQVEMRCRHCKIVNLLIGPPAINSE
jgi:phage FluMu protein Com